jgi:AraC-like DNA-binding protein
VRKHNLDASASTRLEFWSHLARIAGYDERKIAGQCQITVRQLQRRFRQELGRSPEAWLLELRMLDAGKLLLNATQIKTVVIQLGFKQESHFFRTFKATYKMTPTEFIQQKQPRSDNVALGQ